MRLSATDMEVSIQTVAAAEVEEEGRVVIPARIFNDVVRSLPSGELALSHDRSEGVVRLSARENAYRIRAYAAEDFPQLPKFDEAAAFKMSGEAPGGGREEASRGGSAAARAAVRSRAWRSSRGRRRSRGAARRSWRPSKRFRGRIPGTRRDRY